LSERRITDALALATIRKAGDRAAEVLTQAADNAAAADLPPLSPETLDAVKAVYDHAIRQEVQAQW